MKFEVIYYDWDAAKKETISEKLAVLTDLRDACYVAWALREAHKGKPGTIMVFAYPRGGTMHGVNVCLNCDPTHDEYRYPNRQRRTSAEALYGIASEAHRKALATAARNKKRYQWLQTKTAGEHFCKALGALGSESPHYDPALREAFYKDDLNAVEAMLAAKGWLASAALESGVAA